MTVRAFRFLPARYALLALETQEIKVSRFDELNDPFELYGVNLASPEHRVKFREFKRWVSDRYGLLCFSRRWRNPLLWSHYGDRHKGVALEFELDDDIVLDVKYSPYRLRMDIEKALDRGWFSEQEADEVAITKSSHWKYEKEVRVSLELDRCRKRNGIFFEPRSDQIRIVGIVLGPLCDLSEADVQRKLPKGKSIQITWGRLAFTSFNVVSNKAKKRHIVHPQ